MVRDGFFGSEARAIYDLGYLIPFNLVLSAAALVILRYVAQRVVPE